MVSFPQYTSYVVCHVCEPKGNGIYKIMNQMQENGFFITEKERKKERHREKKGQSGTRTVYVAHTNLSKGARGT